MEHKGYTEDFKNAIDGETQLPTHFINRVIGVKDMCGANMQLKSYFS